MLNSNLQCSGDIDGDMTVISVIPVDEQAHINLSLGDHEPKPLVAVVPIRQPPKVDRISKAKSQVFFGHFISLVVVLTWSRHSNDWNDDP